MVYGVMAIRQEICVKAPFPSVYLVGVCKAIYASCLFVSHLCCDYCPLQVSFFAHGFHGHRCDVFIDSFHTDGDKNCQAMTAAK